MTDKNKKTDIIFPHIFMGILFGLGYCGFLFMVNKAISINVILETIIFLSKVISIICFFVGIRSVTHGALISTEIRDKGLFAIPFGIIIGVGSILLS